MKELLIVFLVAVAGCVQTANVVRDTPSVKAANETNATGEVYAASAGNVDTSAAPENKNETERQETGTPVEVSVETAAPTPAVAPANQPTATPAKTPTPTAIPAQTPAATATPSPAATPTITPTPAETPSLNHIILTEVYYDASGTELKEEWIEIYNPLDAAINLSGWSIEDNAGSWSFPGIEINAGSYLRIGRDSSGFYNATGCQPDLNGFTRGLNNDGDQLKLKNNGTEVDFVAWEEGYQGAYPEWNITAAEGKSISRSIIDTDSVSDWAVNEISAC